MKEKMLTGKYFWTRRWFGGFNLWVEINHDIVYGEWKRRYVKGNLADMNKLGISMNTGKND